MADFTNLQAKIDELVAQITKNVTVEGSATDLINGFAAAVTKAVTDALTADNAADQGSIDVAVAAIEGVRASAVDSADRLGAAIVANTPPAPPPAARR